MSVNNVQVLAFQQWLATQPADILNRPVEEQVLMFANGKNMDEKAVRGLTLELSKSEPVDADAMAARSNTNKAQIEEMNQIKEASRQFQSEVEKGDHVLAARKLYFQKHDFFLSKKEYNEALEKFLAKEPNADKKRKKALTEQFEENNSLVTDKKVIAFINSDQFKGRDGQLDKNLVKQWVLDHVGDDYNLEKSEIESLSTDSGGKIKKDVQRFVLADAVGIAYFAGETMSEQFGGIETDLENRKEHFENHHFFVDEESYNKALETFLENVPEAEKKAKTKEFEENNTLVTDDEVIAFIMSDQFADKEIDNEDGTKTTLTREQQVKQWMLEHSGGDYTVNADPHFFAHHKLGFSRSRDGGDHYREINNVIDDSKGMINTKGEVRKLAEATGLTLEKGKVNAKAALQGATAGATVGSVVGAIADAFVTAVGTDVSADALAQVIDVVTGDVLASDVAHAGATFAELFTMGLATGAPVGAVVGAVVGGATAAIAAGYDVKKNILNGSTIEQVYENPELMIPSDSDDPLDKVPALLVSTLREAGIEKDQFSEAVNAFIGKNNSHLTMGEFIAAMNDLKAHPEKYGKRCPESSIDPTPTVDPTQTVDPTPTPDPIQTEDPKPSYDVDGHESTVSTVKTIRYGGPYHYAQLYTDADGNPIRKDSPEFKKLYRQIGKDMKEVEGDRRHRVLPNEIEIDGKKYKLLPDDKINAKIAEIEKTTQGGGKNVRYATAQASNGQWYVVKVNPDGSKTRVDDKTYPSRDAAIQAKQELEK